MLKLQVTIDSPPPSDNEYARKPAVTIITKKASLKKDKSTRYRISELQSTTLPKRSVECSNGHHNAEVDNNQRSIKRAKTDQTPTQLVAPEKEKTALEVATVEGELWKKEKLAEPTPDSTTVTEEEFSLADLFQE